MPNAGPQLTAILTLDGKDYEKGIKKAENQANELSKKLKKMVFKLGGLLVGGLTIKGFTTGIRDAYNYAREMENFSRATGIARDKAAEFDLALKDSMLDANQLQVALRLMSQRLLKAAEGDKQSQHYFQRLSLDWNELLHIPVDEQVTRVGKALAGTKNEALRAAASIQLFGDTGAKMMKLFMRGGAMDLAKEALGMQSTILARSGKAFETISIRLSHIGVKIRGFFLGVAEAIMPVMEKFTDLFHKMDFTGWGAKLGDVLVDAMTWLVTFWNDPISTTAYFWQYVKVQAWELAEILLNSAENFGEALMHGIKAATNGWIAGLAGGMAGMSIMLGGSSEQKRYLAGGAAARAKLAGMRPTEAFNAARESITKGTGGNEAAEVAAKTPWRFIGMHQLQTGSLQGASMAGGLNALKMLSGRSPGEMEMAPFTSLSGMHYGAYGQSNLLRHQELRRIRSAAIAARSGRYLAQGADPSQLGQGENAFDFSARRRPGETANGDRQRARAFAREVQRKTLHQGADSQKLGDIAEYTDGINAKMAKLVEG